MHLSVGDRVFYILSNALLPPATVLETAEDGLLHLEVSKCLFFFGARSSAMQRACVAC